MNPRNSEEEVSAATTPAPIYDGAKFTISPSYVFTDNLSGLVEYSVYNMDAGTIAEPEELLAAEIIYTF